MLRHVPEVVEGRFVPLCDNLEAFVPSPCAAQSGTETSPRASQVIPLSICTIVGNLHHGVLQQVLSGKRLGFF